MKPLPKERFEYVHRKGARVAMDYHVEYDGHYYSVPYGLIRERVEVFAGASTIELLHNGTRVAIHRRSHVKGGYTTDEAHRHPNHRYELDWTPKRLRSWAAKLGPHVELMATAILEAHKYPEHGFRRCLGLLSLERSHGADRVDAACRRALACGGLTYQSVKSILAKNLDRQPLPHSEQHSDDRRNHENVRGATYYR